MPAARRLRAGLHGSAALLLVLTALALLRPAGLPGLARSAPASASEARAASAEPEGWPEISLRARAHPHAGLVDGWPVTTGVPLPRGLLQRDELDGLRLETAAGEAVPAQFEVRARHPASEDVRWLGVTFALQGDESGYRLVRDEGREPVRPGEPVRVERSEGGGVTIASGGLRVEIPGSGGMLRRVALGGGPIVEQGPEDGNWLTTVEGRRYSGRRDTRTEVTVERDGPLHATVRVEGRYLDGEGESGGRWIARLHVFAGRPELRVDHTFVWQGRASERRIRELGLSFGFSAPAERARADRSPAPDDEPLEAALASDSSLELLQERHRHWGHGKSRAVVSEVRAGGRRVRHSGERAGGWIAARNDGWRAELGLRELWQQFPKALRAERQRLSALLWSSAGDAPLFDLRPEALEEFWGPSVRRQLERSRWGRDYRRMKEGGLLADPTGMAKTHELRLALREPGKSGQPAGRTSEAFEHPPRVVPDPGWTFRSGVLGPLGPRDPERFPEWERYTTAVLDAVERLAREWGDYGFFSYGSGPHHKYELRDGVPQASVWRYSNGVEYGYGRAAWLAYLRGGERELFERAQAHTRYLNDVVLCHDDGSTTRLHGDWFWWAGVSVVPWAGAWNAPKRIRRYREEGGVPPTGGVGGSHGLKMEHALLHYYLSGENRSLEVFEEYARLLRRRLESDPEWPKAVVEKMNVGQSRRVFENLEHLGVAYEQLGDPWYREAARRLAEELLVPQNGAGVHLEDASYPRYVFYKVENVWRYAQALPPEAAERDAARRALLQMGEYALRTQEDVDDRNIALRMAGAYERESDARFLGYGARLLRQRRARLARAADTAGYPFRLASVPSMAANAVINTAYMSGILRQAESEPAAPRAAMKEAHLPAAELAFRKAPGEPVALELSERRARWVGPEGRETDRPWPSARVEEEARYVTPTGPWTWRRLRLPPGSPAGTYRLRLPTPGAARVLASDAEALVLEAPEGLALGALGDGPWYFRPAPDAEELRLSGAGLDGVELRGPEGERRALERTKGGEHRSDVRTSEGLWSLRSDRPARLRVSGSRVAFAYGERSRWFDPGAPRAARARESPARAADERWVEGRAGSGLELANEQELVVPLPHRLSGDEGTIELWIRPHWYSTLLPERSHRGVLGLEAKAGSVYLNYLVGIDAAEEPYWALRGWTTGADGAGHVFDARRNMRWSPERWIHLAYVWYREEGQLHQDLYVDGILSNLPAHNRAPKGLAAPSAYHTLRIGGPMPRVARHALDGVVDELRVSRVARYRGERRSRKVFEPGAPLPADEDTSALFRFERTLEDTTGRVEARVEGSP